jgi:spoIIIJ-associated protein
MMDPKEGEPMPEEPVAEQSGSTPGKSEMPSDPAEAAAAPDLEAEGDIAADYLEEFLDIADLDGDIELDVENDRAMVSVVGNGLEALIGSDGEVLSAVQELTRLAVYRETGHRSRLMLDVGGYRQGVRRALVQLADEAVEEVRETGEAVKLAPMTAFERKVIHDAVAERGLLSESDGVEPKRCVVVLPAK